MESENFLNISEMIQGMMLKHKWNQSDVARTAGVSQTTVSNWIRGKQCPRLDEFIPLIRAAGGSLDDLVGLPRSSDLAPDELAVLEIWRTLRDRHGISLGDALIRLTQLAH